MKLPRPLAAGFILLGSALVLIGCDITDQSPVILGEGSARLADGKSVAVYLEMTKGEHLQTSPGESPYTSYFQGTFQFRVSEGDHPFDTLYTGAAVCDGGTELTISQPFTLEFQDYNGDGNPDFTLGQRSAGSTNMLYQLYSLDPDGTIYDLSFSDGHKAFIALADTTKAESFSIQLEMRDGQLIIPYYDTELGEIKELSYRWEKGGFQITDMDKTTNHAELSAATKRWKVGPFQRFCAVKPIPLQKFADNNKKGLAHDAA